jgi:hypothetical protein
MTAMGSKARGRSLCLLAAAVLAAMLAAAPAAAQPELAVQRADPWLPPHARVRDGRASPEGAALQALAVDKLRRRFEAADGPGFGTVSRAQAERAGLGFIAANFDRIDAAKSGHVSFEELRRYLAERAR